MRRITLIILLIGLSAAVAFAAGQGEESEEITLTVWDFKYGEVDGAQPVFKEIDEQFMEKYPNVTVEHVAQPGGADYRNLLSSAAASQSGPDVAIIVPNQNYWAYEEVFVDLNEYVEPWQDEINDLSWDAVSPSGSWEDGIKAVPITYRASACTTTRHSSRKRASIRTILLGISRISTPLLSNCKTRVLQPLSTGGSRIPSRCSTSAERGP